MVCCGNAAGADPATGADSPTCLPHCLQKRLPGASAAPQCEQDNGAGSDAATGSGISGAATRGYWLSTSAAEAFAFCHFSSALCAVSACHINLLGFRTRRRRCCPHREAGRTLRTCAALGRAAPQPELEVKAEQEQVPLGGLELTLPWFVLRW